MKLGIKSGDYLDEEGLAYLEKTLDEARNKSGDTMFDILVETMESVSERSDGRRNIKANFVIKRHNRSTIYTVMKGSQW